MAATLLGVLVRRGLNIIDRSCGALCRVAAAMASMRPGMSSPIERHRVTDKHGSTTKLLALARNGKGG